MQSKKILLITYHFPPSAASGAFRLLGFARHLPAHGWQPLVVAPPTLPWEPIDTRLLEDVPAEAIVEPAPYPIGAPRVVKVLAQNAVWLPRAWFACKRMIAAHRPDVILTSGPPHCVHALGHYLQRRTGLPWVADFRDPWISDGANRRLGWGERWVLGWERRVFAGADLILANAPNACRLYQDTYPEQRHKIVALTNGFDPRPSSPASPAESGPITLLHAGEIYAGRNPAPLFEALASLNGDALKFRLHLLGRCESNAIPALLRERGWTEQVILDGQRTYEETLDAMSRADINVLFDSPGRKIGVPAKLYEYLGAGRPILALADDDGDTANILRASGVRHRIGPPTDSGRIRQALGELADARGDASSGDPLLLKRFTRSHIAGTLAQRLDALVGRSSVTSVRIGTSSAVAAPEMQEAAR